MNINDPKSGGIVLPFLHRNRKQARTNSGRPGSILSNRVPYLSKLPDSIRNHFVATTAEYVGTTLFLLFAFAGTQVALLEAVPAQSVVGVGAPSNTSQLLYIALAFGFSLAVNAWVFFRISGGLFNPAVTLGMCLVGALPYIRGLCLFVAQILGGITAAAICSAILPGPLTVRTSLGGGTSIVRGLFIEMFLTAQLVFTIFMLAAEKHKGTFIAPIGIGLALFVDELVGVYYTGGSVNPARSFGPAVVTHKFHRYHWIYWVGPILGSLLASGFYLFIKMLEYETANPGQDRSKEAQPFNPDLDRTNPSVTFAPDEYAMEEGRGVNGARAGNTGEPNEYGFQKRPYSDSPAPPHGNDQFAGLETEGMDGVASRGGQSAHNPQATPDHQADHQHVTGSQMGMSSTTHAPVAAGTNTSTTPMKSAFRPGSSGAGQTVPKEHSVSSNTYNNRGGRQQGLPEDAELYDKS